MATALPRASIRLVIAVVVLVTCLVFLVSALQTDNLWNMIKDFKGEAPAQPKGNECHSKYNKQCGLGKVYYDLKTALKERASSKDKFIILAGLVDSNSVDFAINLHVSSIAPKLICNMLYIAIDENIIQKTQEYNMTVYLFRRETRQLNTGDLRSPAVNEMSKIRIEVTRLALQMGYTVLLTNLDSYFSEDPVKSVKCDVGSTCDLATHNEGNSSNPDFSTGFMFIRPTDRSLKFYDKLSTGSIIETKDDYGLVNEMYNKRELTVMTLPPQTFCTGRAPEKKDCEVFQANCATGFDEKKKELQQRKMWKYGTKEAEVYRCNIISNS